MEKLKKVFWAAPELSLSVIFVVGLITGLAVHAALVVKG